ncbi:LytTR family DNA-binding domain-containing protein [Acetatifactor muris]|uniref:Stage 0 sporulation protein A homolog n=1 Tax=Acetatifactor muris TaxID=879566 RepID=A0A2K4ZFW4_9FIRM|nr:LytTR family DNA-binding domain-containing protein [Acetatifactor muris]MCR2047637.1 LytTR family DNA-binding domain-containing protein [Acetatifactor muris]SOY29357.1 Transcriptional regulatory protein YehT [Acetatifactor muris]
MGSLYIVICDDEPAQLSWMEAAVKAWAEERRRPVCVDSCRNAEQFLFLREEKREPDLLLLDIDMPGADGMSLARRLRAEGKDMQIAFVTGLAEYALDGYDVEAASYLVKPVEEKRLYACLDKAVMRWEKEPTSLLFETAGGMARVKLTEVAYLESTAHNTWIHGRGDREPIRCITGIQRLEERLQEISGNFFRIHRSCLVNLACVARINRKEITLDTGEVLPVARGRWVALNQAYLEYYRGRVE